MPIEDYPPNLNLPVLVVYDLDPDWTAPEQEDVIKVTSQLDAAVKSLGYQTTMVPVTGSDLNKVFASYDPLEYIIFNWCEKIPGLPDSEWLFVRFLEKKGYTFTGAGSETIALAQDKARIKKMLDRAGILTPPSQVYRRGSKVTWERFPAIVKASHEHCSEGIDRNSVVMNREELVNRINYICEKYRQNALVEEFIDGRELHVSLWGNGTIDMLPPAEMEFSSFADEHDRICSYEAKFVPESEQYQKINTLLPAPLNKQELRTIKEICKDAYAVAGCRDYARIDIRIRGGIVYVIDINPNADISPDTSTIAAAELAGYSYGEFGKRLINLAMLRHSAYRDNLAGNPSAINDELFGSVAD